MNPYNGGIPADQSDSFDPEQPDVVRADQAFMVHVYLRRLEGLFPELRNNPFWTMATHDAYERFWVAFGEVDA